MWQPKNIRVGIYQKSFVMKKISILVLTLLFLLVFDIHAQLNVGATVGAQIPVGSSMEGFKTGLGVNVTGRYLIKENMAIGVNIGYLGLGTPDFGYDEVSVSSSFIPITGLFEYYIGSEKVKPYFGIDAGVYLFRVKASAMGVSASTTETYVGFAPVGGIMIDLSEKISFVANAKYHFVLSEGDNATMIGIHAGVVIIL